LVIVIQVRDVSPTAFITQSSVYLEHDGLIVSNILAVNMLLDIQMALMSVVVRQIEQRWCWSHIGWADTLPTSAAKLQEDTS
jgi:hypothetical protein